MTKKETVIRANPKNIKIFEGAYQAHSNKYFTNAAQFIYASNTLQERVKSCTSVAWYLQGMSIELLCKGLLYSHDRKIYTPKVLAKKPYKHDLANLMNELGSIKILSATERQINALQQLNSFYFDSKQHELRYPSFLSIFTEIKPGKKYERPVVEILKKLMKEADRKADFTKK